MIDDHVDAFSNRTPDTDLWADDAKLVAPDGAFTATGTAVMFRESATYLVDLDATLLRSEHLHFGRLDFLAQLGLVPNRTTTTPRSADARQNADMFDGFDESVIDVHDASILTRTGSAGGFPVLLLHGHPRTSATWHRVAPLLVAAGHTVVCPDLRGYGRSRGPAPTPDHRTQSKRAMAADMVQVMTHLGHDRFALVGHDRGSYVALRLALDHPTESPH